MANSGAIPGLLVPGLALPGTIVDSYLNDSDTASGAESTSINVTLSSAETGSGADAVTSIRVSDTDVISSAEANTLTVQASSSDTGSGAEAVTSIKPQGATDTASSAEAVPSLNVTLSDSDTASGIEATSIHIASSSSDTGSGAESATIGVSSSDTFAGVDSSGSTTATLSAADVASGAEGVPSVAVASSDTGSGADSNGSVSATLTAPDTVTGAESASTTATLSAAETATGVEATTISATLSASDTTTGVEVSSIAVTTSSSDTGSVSSETTSITNSPSVADTSTSVESTTIAATLSASESGTLSDSSGFITINDGDAFSSSENASLMVPVSSADTIASVEFASISATLSDSDTGTLDDEGDGGFLETDFFVAIEASTIQITSSTSDTVSSAESAQIAVADADVAGAAEAAVPHIPVSDSVASTESSSLHASVTTGDTFSATESASVRVLLSDVDTLASTENSTIRVSVSDTEVSGLSDDEVQGLSDSLTQTDSFVGTELTPQIAFATAEAGIFIEGYSLEVHSLFILEDAASFSESAKISVSLSDTMSGADSHQISLQDSDSIIVLAEGSQQAFLGADTASAIESAKVGTHDNEPVSVVEIGSISVAFPQDSFTAFESATVSVAEPSDSGHFSNETANFVIQVPGDGVKLTEGLPVIAVGMTDTWDPIEEWVLHLYVSDSFTATEAQSAVTLPSEPDIDYITITESATVTVYQIGPPARLSPKTNSLQPYYLRRNQRWAVDNERQRHVQALYMLGEWTMFVLMWHIEDFNNGLVDRCHRCYGSPDQVGYPSKQNRASKAYGNVNEYKCPDCFGTTFEGGFKAIIVRPAIFGDTDESQQFQARGVTNPGELDMESTTDFRVRSGDYCFRSTGDRYFLRVPDRITLRTGFDVPYQRTHAIGYNHAKAAIQDPTSVSYTIPPSKEDLASILNVDRSYSPVDFSAFEIIRSPLLPVSEDQG